MNFTRARPHWTEIAAVLREDLRGLDRGGRAFRMRQVADGLGLATHTLRRYLALADFIGDIGIASDEAARLPAGTLEVVLRLWRRNHDSAAVALHAIRSGRLTFRHALALERQVKAGESGEVSTSYAISGVDLRADIEELLALDAGTLVERSVIDDERVNLVQAHRIFAADELSVAYLDEAFASRIVGGHFTAFARTILLAAALFDFVAIKLSFETSVARLEALSTLVRPTAFSNVRVLSASLVGPEDE